MTTTDEGVQRYIDVKKAVLRNMGRIQDQLVRLQELYPGSAGPLVFREIQMILDDPFADGLPSSP